MQRKSMDAATGLVGTAAVLTACTSGGSPTTLLCPVADHRAEGMQTTLTVG
jgi:hypothetical protein